MTTEKTAVANAVLTELFQGGVYKRSQGKYARQITFWAIVATVGIGAYRLSRMLEGAEWFSGARYLAPLAILAAGAWVAFRLVNVARFADFLIAVEAEMNKVSWPTKSELYRSAAVVIFVLFSMSALLFGFDVLWTALFKWVGIVQ